MQGLRSLIDLVKSEEERRMLENFRFMEEQKIKKTIAPRLWEELKKHLAEFCSEMKRTAPSSRIQFHADNANEVSIANLKTGKTASLSYSPDVPCIFCDGLERQIRIGFSVSDDGNAVQFLMDDMLRSPEEVATNIFMLLRT
jgi:hypothetical protein